MRKNKKRLMFDCLEKKVLCDASQPDYGTNPDGTPYTPVYDPNTKIIISAPIILEPADPIDTTPTSTVC